MEVLNLQLKNVQNPGLLCTVPTHLVLIDSGPG